MRRPGLTGWLERIAFHGALLLAALLILIPFLWVASAAFKRRIDLLVGKIFFEPVLTNVEELLFSRGSDFTLNFMNSALVGVTSTLPFDRATIREQTGSNDNEFYGRFYVTPETGSLGLPTVSTLPPDCLVVPTEARTWSRLKRAYTDGQ